MFKIVRLPSRLNSFFRSLTTEFHWDHGHYFRMLVLAVACSWGRRNISNLYRHLDAGTHRSRFNNFLRAVRMDEAALLRQKAYEQLDALNLKRGATVYLILDDSKYHKRGKAMDAVSYFHDPVTGGKLPGHVYVTAVIRVGNVTIPFAIQLYVKTELCSHLGLPFRKTTEMAADIIRAFRPAGSLKIVVLFDSYYLCKKVVEACRQRGYRFVSTLKDNRNLFRNGRKLKTATYKRNVWGRRKHGRVRLPGAGSGRSAVITYTDAGGLTVSELGRLHVIFTRKNGDRRILGIVTDDPRMTASAMIRHYSQRWWIEVFFKDAKQLLGLGQYQNRSYRAAVIHLHLVCFAYALLIHLRRNTSPGEKAKAKRALPTSTAQAQNDLRCLVWHDLVKYLEENPSGDSLVKELERLFVAA